MFAVFFAKPFSCRLSGLTGVDWYPLEPRFEIVYLIHSIEKNSRVRLKCKVSGDDPNIDSVTSVWPGANWYEREVFDLFGVNFRNHPHMRRIMMPDDWEGHPLRRDYPIHGHRYSTTMKGTFYERPQPRPPRFEPVSTDAPAAEETTRRRMTLNMGPQHPSTHGVLRVLLELDGETVISAYPDIGFLHTGIEKQCENEKWHQVVPLTDRVDYLANLNNNLTYALAVEKLLGITDEIPPMAQWMRVMLCELQRINSHCVWLGTHALDIGAMTVFFYCFREREEILKIFEMFSGQRLMTSYIRIGGLALEPPRGWDKVVA